MSLTEALEVEGRHRRITNHGQYGSIHVRAEPSDDFLVAFSPEITALHTADVDARLFSESAIFGLLDVLTFGDDLPFLNHRVTLLNMDMHPVDSSRIAFRRAGRDAGRKILEAAKE